MYPSMEKLLLLLILSFFSTQGFTASCPDGSEPVKSISADGSYFEYKCSADSKESNSTKTTKTTKTTVPSNVDGNTINDICKKIECHDQLKDYYNKYYFSQTFHKALVISYYKSGNQYIIDYFGYSYKFFP